MAGLSEPAGPGDGIPCPYCGGLIPKNSGASQCPYCGEVLARDLRRRLAPPAFGIPIWVVGAALLLCCWPVGAVMVALWAPFAKRWRALLIVGSFFLLVAGCGSYIRDTCKSSVNSSGTGSFNCSSSAPTPTPVRGATPARR